MATTPRRVEGDRLPRNLSVRRIQWHHGSTHMSTQTLVVRVRMRTQQARATARVFLTGALRMLMNLKRYDCMSPVFYVPSMRRVARDREP